jgi:formate hydrogenlyase subunit 4
MKNCNLVFWICGLLATWILAPLLIGIINKTKAFFAGRRGPHWLQLYFDIIKLLRKENVVSTTSGGLVHIAPAINCAILLTASLLLPYFGTASPFSFHGDILLFLYMLATARVFTVLGALDTGSSFEGMGASREVQFSALAEVAFFGVVAFLILRSNGISLSDILTYNGGTTHQLEGTALILSAAALFILLLSENCRVPFDDPETHLELTMIHEAMVLDNGGPGLAAIHYSAALKLYLFAQIMISMLMPACRTFTNLQAAFVNVAGVFLVAVIVGVIESTMARYRFLKVPQMLLTALALAVMAIALLLVS